MTRVPLVLSALLIGALSFAQCPYQPEITAAANEFHVPAPLLTAVAMAESGGDAHAYNPETAAPTPAITPAQARLGWTPDALRASYGLFQVRGVTAWALGQHGPPSALLDPLLSARLAAKLLARLVIVYGSWDAALAAYNGGWNAAQAFLSGAPISDYVARVNASACEP